MTVGEKIKNYRKARGLTQQGLAEKIGVSRSHIAAIEINQYNPSLETLTLIAMGLGIQPGDIINNRKKVENQSNIKNRLKQLREQNKLSLEDVAKIINDTVPNVVIYENNINQPDYNVLKKLAEYYHVSVDYIAGKSHNLYSIPYNPNAENSILITEDRGKIQTFYELDPEEVSLIKAMVHTIKSEKKKNRQ